ncbi:MAG: TetR/AcrR family transcriptional regulator [Spirochaetales bacterium]|nr:TetR/AcrR family transcriptional regulator [Spirochaetales bacterium]
MYITDKNAKTIILNTSIALFSTHGYRETSIREISKKAGVNVSMISYYFGSKDGILRDIVKNITEGFTSLLSKFNFDDINATMNVLKQFLEYLENNRPQIKILFSEIGKGYDYLIPVKEKITELQGKLGSLILGNKNFSSNSELSRKLKIMTDILLGMILSDYIFDFSSFYNNIPEKEKSLWREERIQMLIKILKQLSGVDSGKLTFEPIF